MRQAARYSGLGGVLLSGLIAGGCGSSRPQTALSPYSFRLNSQTAASATTQPTPLKHPLFSSRTEFLAPPQPAPAMATTVSSEPASRPAVGTSSGQYQTIGGVVAEVNGIPIYANKVLRSLRAELAAKAMELDSAQFRKFATTEINKAIIGLQRAELIFGAAERSLTEDEKRQAEFMTMQWRTQQITEAGGSPEMAARKARDDGFEFDDLVFDRYRDYMTQVYLRKNIVPRIQISAQTMREYYTAVVERDFTERAEVTFRLIKVDFARNGGQDGALRQAQRIIERAGTTPFSELATTMNDDSRLALKGGLEQPIQKNAYVLAKVENALWETPIGKIAGPIEDGKAFYLGLVQSRKEAKVQSFESPAVQDRIHQVLWARQFRVLTDQVDDRLRRTQAMVRDSKEMRDTAVQMAMQNYSRWAKGEMDMH